MKNQHICLVIFLILLIGCARKQIVSKESEINNSKISIQSVKDSIQIERLNDSLFTYKNRYDSLTKLVNVIQYYNKAGTDKDSLHTDFETNSSIFKNPYLDTTLDTTLVFASPGPNTPKFKAIEVHYATDRQTLSPVNSSNIIYGVKRANVSYGICYVILIQNLKDVFKM